MTEKLSWKAKLRGNIYCSPACGANCTKDQHDATVSIGKLLASALGEGWTYIVRENLHWYTFAISSCKRIKVSPSIWSGKITGYTAYLGEPDEGCGGRWVASAESPQKAVTEVIKQGQDYKAHIDSLLKGL